LIGATQPYPAFSDGLVAFALRALARQDCKLCKIDNLIFDEDDFDIANLQGRV
jgi:hypothetical protein